MKFSRLTALFVLGFVTMVFAPSSRAQNEVIPGGIDSFVTQPGSFVTIPGIGQIPLMGNPPCMGCADTQIFRQGVTLPDIVGATATTKANVQFLSLESVSPVITPNGTARLFITLDPTMPTIGSLVLTQTVEEGSPTVPEGTLTSSFTFTVDYKFVNVDGATVGSGTLPITGLGGMGIGWNDPDDGTRTFVSGTTTDCVPPGFCTDEKHVIDPVVPEPGTAQLITLAVVGIGTFRRWLRF